MAHIPLPTQVGGHPGILSDSTGSLVIKAAAPREIAFYQHLSTITRPTTYSPTEDIEVSSPSSEALFAFKRYVPKFLGTLQIQGQLVDEEVKPVVSKGHSESIVIENITYPFFRPSVLDVKLGTITYEPDATEEKKARLIAAAEGSTSSELGIRLTGFKTWHPNTGEYVLTNKDFGRTASKDRLPEGMARFFPEPTADHTSSSALNHAESSQSGSSNPIPSISPSDHRYNLIRVLRSLHNTLAHLHSLLSAVDIRWTGTSLLIVYEGDPEALEKAWKNVDEGKVRGDGLAMEEEGDDDDEGDGESEEWFGFGKTSRREKDDDRIAEEEEGVEGNERDGDDEEEGDPPTQPWSIRVIDFAHTRLVDGEGPDFGALLGIRSFGGLVRGRIGELGGDEESDRGKEGSLDDKEEALVREQKEMSSVEKEEERSRDETDSGVGMKDVKGQGQEENQNIEL